ncbi:MAG: T9SS type A sorting domain-containing protein [Chitinophagaceae bacterium]
MSKVSSISYFVVSKGAGATVNAANILVNYGPNDAITDAPNLRIAKSNGTSWDDLGGTGTAVPSGSITSTNSFTTFSDFVLANATGGMNVLPLRWVQVDAQMVGNKVEVRWETNDEQNCSYFVVERSADALQWAPIGRVPAKNTPGINKYILINNLQVAAIMYYRIGQVDLDGKRFYSKIVTVKNTRDEKSAIIVKSNPVRNALITAEIYDQQLLNARNIVISITDMSGKQVYKKQKAPGRHIEINVALLKKGIYVLAVNGGTTTKETKIIIE